MSPQSDNCQDQVQGSWEDPHLNDLVHGLLEATLLAFCFP